MLITRETSLTTVAEKLDPVFKSISRKYVIGQHAITRCVKLPGGKYKLTFDPENKEEEVSKIFASPIENWILEKVPIEILETKKK